MTALVAVQSGSTASDPNTAKITADLFTAAPVPVYYQLAQAIARLVDDGSITQGMALESVDVIARTLGVSANTVRRAFQHLDEEAILSREVMGRRVVVSHCRRSA